MTDRRQLLTRTLTLAFGAIVLGSIFVLGRSLSPSESARAAESFTIPLPELEEDHSVSLKVGKRTVVLIARLSAESLRRLPMLDSEVGSPDHAPVDPTLGLVAFRSWPEGQPCAVRHIPRGADFVAYTPNWQGGFFQPCGEVSYDYFGRTIRGSRFAIYGRGSTQRNLDSLRVSRKTSGELELQAWPGS